MRTIRRATNFKKDFKRVLGNPHHAQDASELLEAVLVLLVEDKPLPEGCRDHALVGNWKHHRECHIKPDLLLIYSVTEPGTLQLVRLGSHAELFSR